MSNTENRYAYENLTQSGLFRLTSKDDKQVSLSINAFGGSTAISVFAGGGGKPWSQTMKRRSIRQIVLLLEGMRNDIRPCRETIMINTWDQEAKRAKQIGHIAFGIDDNLQFMIEVAGDGVGGNGKHVFPVRTDLAFDFSNTSLTDKDVVKTAIDTVIEALTVIAPIAERMTSFKKQFGGSQGGGNRGGYGGGNRQSSGGYNGGGNQRQGSSTFGGGGNAGDDEIAY